MSRKNLCSKIKIGVIHITKHQRESDIQMILDKNNKTLLEKYNNFVKNSPYGHFQQDIRWADLKAGWESVYFYIEEKGDIRAALSVIYIRDKKVGKNFFYGPRGPVCDPENIEDYKKIIEEAKEFAKNNDGFLLRIDPYWPRDLEMEEKLKEAGLNFRRDKTRSSQPLLNMVLDINGRSEEEILAIFSKNTRKHLRKSYKDGIVTKILQEDGIKILYDQIEETALRAKIGHRPFEYFKKLYDLFKDEIRLSVSFYEGKPLCTSLLVCYGNRATSLYGGSSDQYKNMSQNYQLNFEEIKYSIENKLRYYDMGGIFETDGTDGLYNFKKKFTEDNVFETIGEIDIVIDPEVYNLYMKDLNPHYKREENESNRS